MSSFETVAISLAIQSANWLPFSTSLGVLLLLLALTRRRSRTVDRLAQILAEPGDLANNHVAVSVSHHDRFLRPLFHAAGLMMSWSYRGMGRSHLERKLTVAGRPHDWTATEFIGFRAALTIASAVATLAIFSSMGSADVGLLMAVIAGMVAYVIPGMWLGRRISGRQTEVGRDLPDVLDMLSLCLDAGLSLESAVDLASERWRGALMDELRQALREVRLGQSRHDSLRRMAQRADVGELSALVAAMIQAEQLGTGLRNTLKLQAVEARSAYRNRVRESAYKAPIKMIIPMTLFILPAMFIVIIGPVVPQMAGSVLGQ